MTEMNEEKDKIHLCGLVVDDKSGSRTKIGPTAEPG